MGTDRQSRILHVDMDAFFAAVELQRHPELVGLPVIVGGHGDPTERGVVSTASYEARAFGVHSGLPLRIASSLCPGAKFLPVDFSAYLQVSRKIKRILVEFSPAVEDAGIDEAYLDISGNRRPPQELAKTLKKRILQETGLTCSVGIAPNKLLAKIASDLEKPDGLTLIGLDEIESRLWLLPARVLPGVGPKTEERLGQIGAETVGELAALPLEVLVARFGASHGSWLCRAARGIDDRPLVTHRDPKSMSREVTFQQDLSDRSHLSRILGRFAAEVGARMRRRGWLGRTVTVKIRYRDFETHIHSLTLPQATNDLKVLRAAAGQCFDSFPLAKKVRLIGFRVSGLEKRGGGDGPGGTR